MQEFERQQYLALMGIQSWMPRKPLSYAPPLVYIPLFDCERLDQQPLSPCVDSDNLNDLCKEIIPENGLSATASPVSDARDLAHFEPLDAAPVLAADLGHANIPPEQVQPWQFSFLVWEDKLLCFQSLQRPDAAKLAQAILGAVTDRQDHCLAEHQWPLFPQEPLESATIRLRVFMKTLRLKVNLILCFGALESEVFRPLLEGDWLAEHQRCVELPSLAVMLEDPSQKSIAWKQLKPLFLKPQSNNDRTH